MRRLFWTAVLVAIALAMPASAWIFAGLFGAALVFACGLWALALITRGFVKAWRQGDLNELERKKGHTSC